LGFPPGFVNLLLGLLDFRSLGLLLGDPGRLGLLSPDRVRSLDSLGGERDDDEGEGDSARHERLDGFHLNPPEIA
jgi:hypothetical protein